MKTKYKELQETIKVLTKQIDELKREQEKILISLMEKAGLKVGAKFELINKNWRFEGVYKVVAPNFVHKLKKDGNIDKRVAPQRIRYLMEFEEYFENNIRIIEE